MSLVRLIFGCEGERAGKMGSMNMELRMPMGGLRMAWDGITDRRVDVG